MWVMMWVLPVLCRVCTYTADYSGSQFQQPSRKRNLLSESGYTES